MKDSRSLVALSALLLAACGSDDPKDVTLPSAAVTFPATKAFTTAATSRLVGTASDDAGPVSAVTVNGQPVTTTDNFATWSIDVTLNQGVNTFTMGFNLGGTGVVQPFTTGSGIVADIDNGVLNFSSFSMNARHAGVDLLLFPDSWAVQSVTDLGNGNYGVVVEYVAWIDSTVSTFSGFPTYWRLEGVMATAPVPEAKTYAMLLAGLGLIGFLARRRAPAPA